MVARITTPKSLQKTFNYNEKKVQQGTAICIGESGFLLPLNKMNFYDKLELFENRNRLNERATTKTLHVSLNFSNEEKYEPSFYMRLAEEYMTRIGFGEQPFLVYQHKDAGHPHIHILSTTIRRDGTRIETHNIGRNHSEPARKEMEVKYGLVKAENQKNHWTNKVLPFDLGKVNYGKVETKRGIAAVLNGVVGTYNYTSLPEFNAVLRLFNVMADRCAPDGFIYSKKGLLYRVLDKNGTRIGVPIKASTISGNPTLANLEKKFENNKRLRDPLRLKLKTKIDNALSYSPASIAELSTLLASENVIVVKRQNEEGKLYGITFVDHEHRCVFNGSEVDRQFSVAGLQKLLSNHYQKQDGKAESDPLHIGKVADTRFIEFNGLSPLEVLISPENEFNNIPYPFRRKRRKRKR
jgi:hypothetical protein